MRLVAVTLCFVVLTGCMVRSSGRPSSAQSGSLDRAILVAAHAAAGARSPIADDVNQPFLFVGDLLNGDHACAPEYGFTFEDERSLGAVEGQDAEGRIYHCRYASELDKGAVEWTADCEVKQKGGAHVRVLTMMHTALEPRLTNGIDAYDAFWVRGIVDLESGAALEECAYGGQVVHRAAMLYP